MRVIAAKYYILDSGQSAPKDDGTEFVRFMLPSELEPGTALTSYQKLFEIDEMDWRYAKRMLQQDMSDLYDDWPMFRWSDVKHLLTEIKQ